MLAEIEAWHDDFTPKSENEALVHSYVAYLRRVVDLVTAEGSAVVASKINHGYVVVIDGRTGKDACERSTMAAIQVLLDEMDGLGSPGRLCIDLAPDDDARKILTIIDEALSRRAIVRETEA
jgi:hypothetical protein